MKNIKWIRRLLAATFPVLSGYTVLGIGFGVLATKNGIAFKMALAMSLFIYAGSMQYAAIGLLATGVDMGTMALATLMINARHVFYGISMIGRYRKMGAASPYLIFALTDETYSLVAVGDPPEGVSSKTWYVAVSAVNHFYWVAGTAIGAALGSTLSFDATGLEFSMTALFVAVFVEQWQTSDRHAPAMIGVLLSVLCLLIFGADRFLIPAMLGIGLVLCFMVKGGKADGRE